MEAVRNALCVLFPTLGSVPAYISVWLCRARCTSAVQEGRWGYRGGQNSKLYSNTNMEETSSCLVHSIRHSDFFSSFYFALSKRYATEYHSPVLKSITHIPSPLSPPKTTTTTTKLVCYKTLDITMICSGVLGDDCDIFLLDFHSKAFESCVVCIL